jgi:hypothetical protein
MLIRLRTAGCSLGSLDGNEPCVRHILFRSADAASVIRCCTMADVASASID